MKKSTIMVVIGTLIVVTALLCINSDEKMYQKQKQFQTVNEVLEQLENNPIQARNEKGYMTETSQFKECLSKRKRLTNSQLNCSNISIQKIEELDEKQKETRINKYNECQDNLTKKHKITRIEPVTLDAKINRPYDDRKSNEERKIDLILVDEGEGLVIDYVVEYQTEEQKEKGEINAEG